MTSRGRLRTQGLVVVLVGALVLGACGGADGSAGDRPVPAAADDGSFPVEIEHKYGTTEIAERPERVVAVGLVEQDALLALGVVPVATTEWFGEHPGAIWPWAEDELGDADPPEVLSDVDGIQFERIAALRPDVIIGLYAGLTVEDYETLSAIAPTVAQPEAYVDFGVPWQELTRTVGQIVGRADEAEALVADVEARFAGVRRDHPEFEGATGLMLTPYEGIFVYGPEDPRGRFLEALGFELPAGLAEVTADEYGADISREQIAMIDADVLVWLMDTGQPDIDRLHADALYANLGVAEEGREVFLAGGENLAESVYGATSFVTVLSLPFLLDALVPMLAAAVDGDPATAVE